METLIKDVRYGVRMLLKSPGFTIVAVLSLALGIGANTAVFSIVSSFLFAPLPVDEPARLVTISTADAKNPGPMPMSHLNYLDYRDKSEAFSDILAYSFAAVSYSGGSGEPKQLFGLVVSGNYFDVLGVRAAFGRTFLPDEDKTPATHPVAVISYASWQRDFGADPQLVGKTISLNRHDFAVVGIAPKDFTGTDLGFSPDLWVPMMMHLQIQPAMTWYNQRRGLFLLTIGRLNPDVTVEQAQSSMSALGSQLEQEYRTDNEGRNVKLVPLLTARKDPGGDGEPALISGSLMGVALIVLLIACANVTNLLLARGTKRSREISIRLAIGASRGRLIRQLMTESLVLSAVGGVAGFLVAFWSKDLLRAWVPFGDGNPAESESGLDAQALLFAVGIAAVSGVVFGLAPALQASKPDLVPTLKGEITVAGAPRGLRFNLRKALVVVQVALSLFALITAGLFVRSLQEAQAVNPGFNTENVLLMAFDLGREGYAEPQGRNFHRQLIERVGSLQGIQAVAIARDRPFGGGFQRSVFIEGQEPAPGGRGVLVQTNNIGLKFFDTMGIPILKGRDFTEQDSETAPKTLIINEAMAERFWPGADPVGKRLKLFGDEDYREVVAVVRDTKYNSLTERRRPFMYIPVLQEYASQINLHARTASDPTGMVSPVRQAIQGIDSRLAPLNIQTLSERIDNSLGDQRMQATMLGTFGVLALVLAAVGLYGVMAYSVAQRTREIGIRMALGAQRKHVLGLVLKQGVTLVSAGVVVGLGAAFAATRLISNLLFGVSAVDPVAFAGTSVLLIVVALLASYIPARRATKVDPLIALRYE